MRSPAEALYQRIPFCFRWVFSPLVFCSRLFRQIRPDVWILSGEEQSSRIPLAVLCSAHNWGRSYLAGLIFGASFQEEYLGRAWLWNVSKMSKKTDRSCSLMLVQVSESLSRLLGKDNWFYIPGWVVGEVDIPPAPVVMNSESVKSDLRRIRKNELQFEVTREIQCFDDFYYHMYVPYITGSHGSSAYVMPYKVMRKRFRNCDLLLVEKQDQQIAGILIEYSKRGARLWSLGVLDGDPKYLKDGVVGALFHFSLLYLEGKGFSKVGFGLSKAFLRDGVLKYKRKWAQKIVGVSRDGFALKILSQTAAARSFLRHNPFMFKNCGSIHAAVFLDEETLVTPQELERIKIEYSHPGLSRLFVYLPHPSDAVKQDVVPAELSGQVVLRSLEDVNGLLPVNRRM